MRPQDGWVRAKNARRLEDLEEITHLQRRMMEVEAENARLKDLAADPTAAFSQGDDEVRWVLALTEAGPTEDRVRPPVTHSRS